MKEIVSNNLSEEEPFDDEFDNVQKNEEVDQDAIDCQEILFENLN